MSNRLPGAEELRQGVANEDAQEIMADFLRASMAQAGECPDDLNHDLWSLGHTAAFLHFHPDVIRALMKEAKIDYAFRINQVPYLDGYAIIKLSKLIDKTVNEHKARILAEQKQAEQKQNV